MTVSLQLVKAFDRTPTKFSEFEYLEGKVICKFAMNVFTKKQGNICTYEKRHDRSINNIGYIRRKITFK